MTRQSRDMRYSFSSAARILGILAFAFGLMFVMAPQSFANHDIDRDTEGQDHPDP